MTLASETFSIPMSSPDLGQDEIDAVLRVIKTSQLSIGPEVAAFEDAFARYVGVDEAIAVSSGTSGLHECVVAAGIGEGHAVITTPFSFVASANAVLYERATPIFVDVEEVTGNIDPVLVAEAADGLTGRTPGPYLPPRLQGGSVRRTLRALLPVHTFGQPADIDPLRAVAQKHDLLLIEDACEAIGATYKTRNAGTLGDAAVFAFYPNKQMTTGEGGMIVTNRAEWGALFRSLRNQGRDEFDAWLNHSRLGYNYRLDEMSAALGRVQLGRLDELLRRRQQVADWYTERLSGRDGVQVPLLASSTTRMSWFVYVVRILPPFERNRVMDALAAHSIPSRPYFSPIHLQPFYMERFGYQRGDFPVAERLGDVSLALPFSGIMTEAQVDRVCDTLNRVLMSGARAR